MTFMHIPCRKIEIILYLQLGTSFCLANQDLAHVPQPAQNFCKVVQRLQLM